MRNKKHLSLLFLLLIATPLFPIPAKPDPIIVEQEDGTYITIFLRGDEKFHYFITEDGIPLIQEQVNKYCYAISRDSVLVSSGILAHNNIGRSDVEKNFIYSNKEKAIITLENIYNSFSIDKEGEDVRNQRSKRMASIGQPATYIGEKKGLVILVEFDDLKMSVDEPLKAFDMAFNEKGYNKNNHIGSVSDYFYDQSYGKFNLSFDVIGPVKISKNYSYYGANSSWNSQKDIHAGQFATEACKLADDFVDYSKYDWDGDGIVEQVFLIYAGYGEHSGASSYTIWPHKGNLYSHGLIGDGDGVLQMDGVKVNDYACSCELSGTKGNNMNGIGTACHEFSHCLGLPDFYDVKYNGGFGMNSWDLMDSGGHNGPSRNGEVPSGYSAYERWFAGWLSFTELKEMARIKGMECIADSPIAYKICNDNNENEYFILENRQNRGWFSYVNTSENCHGMLITHVDYLASEWEKNSINTKPSHQRMSVVPADNSFGDFYDNGSSKGYIPTNEDLEGDLFPGSQEIREFTNQSHKDVGGALFNENIDKTYCLNKPITNIKENNGLISFDFMGGIYVESPTILETTVLSNNSFMVTWNNNNAADSYILEAREIRDKSAFESIALNENFNNFRSEDDLPDGEMDVSLYLNSYTNSAGWKGKNIYTSNYGAKIGKSGNIGFIQTPMVTINSGVITTKASIYAKEEVVITIAVLNHNNDTVCKKNINLKIGESSLHEQLPVNQSGEYSVWLSGNLPIYLKNIVLYDGSFTEKETSNKPNIDSLMKPLETYLIEGIKNSTYTLSDLKVSKFKVRVRAEQDEALSEWSEYREVDCNNANSIDLLYKNAESSCRIYNLNGINLQSTNKSGIYIINDGTTSKKVIVK